MIKIAVLSLFVAVCSSLTLEEYLLNPPQSDTNYLTILSSKPYLRCIQEFAYGFRGNLTLPENTEFIEQYGTEYYSLLGLTIQDVPAIRLIKNKGEVFSPLHPYQPYSLNFSQIQDFVDNPQLQVYDRQLETPISYIDSKLARLNENRFTEAIYYFSGNPVGYDRTVVLLGIAIATTLTGVPLFLLYKYVKSHWGKPLETKHAVHLLGFWALIQAVFMNHFHADFYYHHQWKITTMTQPVTQWYKYRCYRADYPPLWMYIEMFESYFLKIFFPDDLLATSILFESTGFRLVAGVLNIVVNSAMWFALLKLMRTIQVVFAKPRVTVNVFAFCLINLSFMYTDGTERQPNQFVLSIVILSISYMLEKKYLKSAFWYCIAVNVKQISFYYSQAYFLFLLFVYCYTPQFNRKNFKKLACVVVSNVLPVYLPFTFVYHSIYTFMTGGHRPPQQYPMSNLNSIWALSEYLFKQKFTGFFVIPAPLKGIILIIWGRLLARFMRTRLQERHFPLFCFISCFAFFHLMNNIHAKHIAYMEIPFMIHALITMKENLKYEVFLRGLAFFHVVSGTRDIQIFAVKYPLHFYYLWQFKQYAPQFFKYYIFQFLAEISFDVIWLFFRLEFPLKFIVLMLYSFVFYYKLMLKIWKRDTLKDV